MPVIGLLIALAEDDPETKSRLAAFRQGLQKRGWAEGRNVGSNIVWAARTTPTAPGLRKNWSLCKVDVILAHSPAAVRRSCSGRPHDPDRVLHAADPIGSGLVASLARPGGNVTGVDAYGRAWRQGAGDAARRSRRARARRCSRQPTVGVAMTTSVRGGRGRGASLAVEVQSPIVEQRCRDRALASIVRAARPMAVWSCRRIHAIAIAISIIALAARHRAARGLSIRSTSSQPAV